MNEQAVIEVFRHFAQTHACSVNAILTTPELRREYLAEARTVLGPLPEQRTPTQTFVIAETEQATPFPRPDRSFD